MNVAGLGYILFSALAYGIMPIWVKLAYMTGLSTYEVIFGRGFLGACVLYLFIRGKKVSLRLERSSIKSVLLVGICGYTAAAITLYYAYNYITVGAATALHYLFPVIVMVCAVVFYRERLTFKKLVALICAVAGTYVITAAGQMELDAAGVFFGIVSAFAFAFYVLGVAHPSIKAIDGLVFAFYLSAISAVVSFVMVLIKGEWPVQITAEGLLYLLLLAVFCTALALLFFNRGVQLVGPSTASILATLEPVVSIVAGIIVLQEKVTLPMGIGFALILGAVLILAWPARSTVSQSLGNSRKNGLNRAKDV